MTLNNIVTLKSGLYRVPQKTRLFLRSDNFATTNDRKAYNRSLKVIGNCTIRLIAQEFLCVFHSIVNMSLFCTVTEIFSVQYWRDLEIWIRGRYQSYWKSHRSVHHIIYDILLVCHCNYSALSCTISSYLMLNNIVTLKSSLGVTQDHWKWHHSIEHIRVRIRLSLYLVSCTAFEAMRDIGRKTPSE